MINPAPLYKRLLALVYDALLVIALLFLATFLALWFNGGEPFGPNNIGFLLYLVACAGSYLVLCWVNGGQTLGMKAWRLRVQNNNQSFLNYHQALQRYLASCLGFWLFGLNYIWCVFDKNKQSLADRLCQTQVISILKT